jgi:hypothetical protein
MSKTTAVSYVRDYLTSVRVKVGERENAKQVATKLAEYLQCTAPISLHDANTMLSQFAAGKRALLSAKVEKYLHNEFKPLKRVRHEYPTTRHIPSLVSGKRVYWNPLCV